MNFDEFVFIDIATTSYNDQCRIIRLCIVDIHNHVLFDQSFKTTLKVHTRWKSMKIESEARFQDFSVKILKILTRKVIVAFNSDFVVETLKKSLLWNCPNVMHYMNWIRLCESFNEDLKHICLMKILTCIDYDPNYRSFKSLLTRFNIDHYEKDSELHLFKCHEDLLHNTFATTELFKKLLSFNDSSSEYLHNFEKLNYALKEKGYEYD